ncbi:MULTISPECIES: phage antirepressor KilAC domain-containing protein [unclassified Nostoc]|uniref:phage antirepressor KilAC domain-containing protein n=1 Tax=unclassified Nostoc TaxID=2593658 RepID=UPI002AD2728D|nr:phage antirepressor KilAC domain-containing protein [Nostoc sp. DedQUE03]MDZ7975505.1 phage antirepressor KilAC domain-containing protein [Nostoc sp. DedQUE03]MDZ8045555.1 phage antirepressor KilAC domain-containing protein [Nostoc sp. DedQUE02]
MSNLTISNQNGIQYFTINATGESGMSQSGLARACGVDEKSIRRIIETVRTKAPSPILESFTGKGLEDLALRTNSEYQQATILKDTFCAAVLTHYAQQGRTEAAMSLGAFAAIGIRVYIQQITGWVAPVESNQPKLPSNYREALLALVEAEDEKERLALKAAEAEAKVVQMAPKVEVYDVIAESGKLLSFSEAAKIINSPSLGRNNLMQLLRDKRVLQIGNLPYQQYVSQGYFEVVETITNVGVKPTCKVTQKGLSFLIRFLQKEGYRVPSKAA